MRSPIEALKHLAWQRKTLLHKANQQTKLDRAVAELIALTYTHTNERWQHLFKRLSMSNAD